jgi:GT2 family glycosyltransferase
MSPQITVCVAVYNGATFVEKTLGDIQSQSFSNLNVLISVDHSQDESLAICQKFTQDSRFTVFEQPQRLGWVQNTNFLLDRVQTPYYCIMPHDDRIQSDYLDRLYQYLLQFPQAAAVYCDVEFFGSSTGKGSQSPLLGDRLNRAISFLTTQFDSALYRGLVRRSVVGIARLIDNPYQGFAADSVWILQLACKGTLHRLPETLYRKWIDPSTAHHAWKQWHRERAIAAWAQHCADCTQIILQTFLPEDYPLLLFACLNRTLKMTRSMCQFVEISDLLPVEKDLLLTLWMSHVLQLDIPLSDRPFTLQHHPAIASVLAAFYAPVERAEPAQINTPERLQNPSSGAGEEF